MLCACSKSLANIVSALSGVGPNARLAAGLSGGLGSLAGSANAALAANLSAGLSGGLAGGLSGGLSGLLGLGANLNLSAMANLSALANFMSNMKIGFGIDMASGSALADINDLLASLAANGWNQVLSSLPLGAAAAALGPLGSLAGAMPSVAANLGINLTGPTAAAQLAASLNASTAASANAAAALGLSASAAANLAAQLSASANLAAALSAGFGISGPALGLPGLGGLGGSLAAVAKNLAGLPNIAAALSETVMKALGALLDALGAINRSLGVNLGLPGAGAMLGGALAAAASGGFSSGGNFGLGLGLGLNQSLGASGNMSASSALSAAHAFGSPAFGSLLGMGIPGVPGPAALLAALASKLISVLGIPMAERSPCGLQCMFLPFLPPGCLCPKTKAELPKLSASASGGAGASGANAGGDQPPPFLLPGAKP